MRVTTNMGLTAPASNQDVYSWEVRAQNLYLIDFHDHSPGRGTRLTGASIAPGSLSGLHISTIIQAINPSQAGLLVGSHTLNVPISTAVATGFNVVFSQTYQTAPLVFTFAAFDSSNAYVLISNATSVSTTGFTLGGRTTATVGTTSGGYNFAINWLAVPNA